MAKGKVNNLTVEQLKTTKKLGTALLAILIVAIALNVSLALYGVLLGNELNTALLVSALACLLIAIPIYLGRKNIDLALRRKGSY